MDFNFSFDSQPVRPHLMIDGSNLAYRAFHATPAELATSNGHPSGAIMGFTRMLVGLLCIHGPQTLVVAWDMPGGKDDRLGEWEQYKAGRKEMPEALRDQWPVLAEAVTMLGGINWGDPGCEADDLIASWARQHPGERKEKIIVSGDKDLLTLVEIATVLQPQNGGQYREATTDFVRTKYGIEPEQMSEFLALVGDSSDGWPGVPGIGPVAAKKLLNEYKTIHALETSLALIKPAGVQKKLTDHQDMLTIGANITRLRDNLPLPEIKNLTIDLDSVKKFARQWELSSLRFDDLIMFTDR